jgi:hypothetical protein
MSLRHWPIFDGAPMAQQGLRHCHRRPKENPMAHWLRLWFSPNGAPMAQRRGVGKKISARRHLQNRSVEFVEARTCPFGGRTVSGSRFRDMNIHIERASAQVVQRPIISSMNVSPMYEPGAEHSMALRLLIRRIEVKCRTRRRAHERDIPIVKTHRPEPSAVFRMSPAAKIVERTI